MGERLHDVPPKEYILTDDSDQNFWTMLEGRTERDLKVAKRNRQPIVCDGIDVSHLSHV